MAEVERRSSRTWVIVGGLLAVVLACVVLFFFMVSQYGDAMTAYAWVQNANSSDGNLNDMLCEDAPQAERFNVAFRSRYGSGARLNVSLSEFEQEDDHVRLSGDIEFEVIIAGETQTESEDFEAIFYLGEGDGNGFLGLLGCIERIEQIEPDTIPKSYFGG